MTLADFLATAMEHNLAMLSMHLADFTDADLLVRPVPGANHAAWQLGHLALGESKMIEAISPGHPSPLPNGWEATYAKEAAKSDDAKAFGGKEELLATIAKVRGASIAHFRGLSDADLAKPTPEHLRGWIPTVGDLGEAVSGHALMHIGQIQVIRRKLGKPVLF